MTKRGNRERLDDPEPTPRRRTLERDWKPEPAPRPKVERQRVVRDAADDPIPSKYVDGEYRTENLLRRMGAGRPKGSGNLVPRKITDSFMQAIEQLGSDGHGKDGTVGYFMRACSEQPAAALAFASRLLPRKVQTSTDPDSALGQILEAARARLQYEKAKTIDMRLKDRR